MSSRAPVAGGPVATPKPTPTPAPPEGARDGLVHLLGSMADDEFVIGFSDSSGPASPRSWRRTWR